jgi:glycerol-3-phosphate acyltransferase PlsX
MSGGLIVAVDIMGGDYGPSVTVPACINFLINHPSHKILAVGDSFEIKAIFETLPRKLLKKASVNYSGKSERMSILHTSEKVLMNDPPAIALKNRRESSMWKSIEVLKKGEVGAVVSAGNTGALMAISRYLLKTLDGIDRPAIASSLPNRVGTATTVLDLGANVECSAKQLCQFAMMGSALVSVVDLIPSPSVGLLNIGEENIKGNEVVKAAGEMLRLGNLNFVGNVEGDDIFKGNTNVIVCDGFVGNVALKTSEGLAQMVRAILKEEYNFSVFSKLAALMSINVMKRFASKLDHRRYNGAALLGLKGVVYKSHGSADSFSFGHAIARAADAAGNGLNDKINDELLKN